MNKHIKMGVFVMLVVLVSGSVFAFGVGSAYHREHPLELSRGETTDVKFNLQNMAGGKNLTVRPSVTKGSELMNLNSSEDIFLPLGASIDVIGKVIIPADAKIGDVYPVEISFTTVTKSGSGEFGFGSSVGRDFDVIVVYSAEELAELEEKPAGYGIYLTIGLIVLAVAVVGWFMLRRKK